MPPSTQNIPQSQPGYYTGKVVMDTGNEPPAPVAILRICNGTSRREAITTGDGGFTFLTNTRNSVVPDASDSTRGFGPESTVGRASVNAQRGFDSDSAIADCELRAELPGFTSSTIRLDSTMKNTNVGILVLHSRSNKKGDKDQTVSVASLVVPTKARKEFEKGTEALEAGDLAGAQKHLLKATEEYPKYAEAWMRLGDLQQHAKDMEGARKNYEQAVASDPNFPLPYIRLAYLSAVSHQWDETRVFTEKAIALDPVAYPQAYYFNGVANLNLNHLPQAETSALRAESLDKLHSEPQVELLLATIYTAQSNYTHAAEHYRTYLTLKPNGPLTERVKTDLAKMEEMAKAQTTPMSK